MEMQLPRCEQHVATTSPGQRQPAIAIAAPADTLINDTNEDRSMLGLPPSAMTYQVRIRFGQHHLPNARVMQAFCGVRAARPRTKRGRPQAIASLQLAGPQPAFTRTSVLLNLINRRGALQQRAGRLAPASQK